MDGAAGQIASGQPHTQRGMRIGTGHKRASHSRSPVRTPPRCRGRVGATVGAAPEVHSYSCRSNQHRPRPLPLLRADAAPRTWYTADLHIGHRLIADNRGSSSLEAHDVELADRWDNTVADVPRRYCDVHLSPLPPVASSVLSFRQRRDRPIPCRPIHTWRRSEGRTVAVATENEVIPVPSPV